MIDQMKPEIAKAIWGLMTQKNPLSFEEAYGVEMKRHERSEAGGYHRKRPPSLSMKITGRCAEEREKVRNRRKATLAVIQSQGPLSYFDIIAAIPHHTPGTVRSDLGWLRARKAIHSTGKNTACRYHAGPEASS